MRDLSIADVEFIVTKNPVFVESLRDSSYELFCLLSSFADPSVDFESKEHIAYSLATNDDYRKILFSEMNSLLPQRTVDDVKDIFDTMLDWQFAYIIPTDSLPVEDKRYDEKSFTYANGREFVKGMVALLDPIIPSPSSWHLYLFWWWGIASKFPPEIEAIETWIKMHFVLLKNQWLSMLWLSLEVAYSDYEEIYPIIINNMGNIYRVLDHIIDKKMTFREALMNTEE